MEKTQIQAIQPSASTDPLHATARGPDTPTTTNNTAPSKITLGGPSTPTPTPITTDNNKENVLPSNLGN